MNAGGSRHPSFGCGCDPAHGAALALGVAGDADGDQQRHAVEQRLDAEGAAELLDAGDADREDGDADERAPDIDAAGLDRGRAEEGADQGRQQVFEADAGLADAQLRGEQHAGQRRQAARGDEGADDEAADRDAVERRGLRVGADGVEVAADRQVFEDDPQHDGDRST